MPLSLPTTLTVRCRRVWGGCLQTIESEQRSRDEAREQHQASERRAMVLAGEIEELRAQVEAAERARKIAESELHEASDRVSELSASASSFSAQKRKLENDIQAMHVSHPNISLAILFPIFISFPQIRMQSSLGFRVN